MLSADERGQTRSPDIFERLDAVAAELDAHRVRDETAALRERESDGRFYAEREEARAFTTQVLTRRLRASSPSIAEARVFAVSALEQLDGRGPKRDWEALLCSLRELSERSGRAIVRASINRGIARITASLLALIDEEMLALTQPFEESERRLIDLRKRAATAVQSHADLGPLMAAEETRVARVFQDRRRRFLEEAAPPASRELQERLSALGVSPARMRRTSFIAAQNVARETIEPFLADSEVVANEVYISAASRFVALANEATRDVGAAHAVTASDLEDLPARFAEGARLRGRRQFHFHSYEQLAAPAGLGPAVRGVLNAIAPRAFVVRRTERAAHAFLAKLLETNASRVEGDVMARVVESRRLLESEIRGALARAVEMAGTALERARTAHADGRDSVMASIARLEQHRSMLTTLDVPHVRRNAEDSED